MIEKKFAPLINVITKVKAKMRGACLRRDGNMGYLAPFTSQTQKATMSKNPRISGARTCAELHLYYIFY